MDLVELTEAIRQDIRCDADVPTTLRLVRQFIMDTGDSDHLVAATAEPPPSTGDERWDALIAGVIEDLALSRGLPVPAWTAREPLDEWWFVTTIAALEPTAFVETPPALAHRGVFIRRATLVNV